MKPKLYITNTSQYPDHEVDWLVKFAFKEVRDVAQRENWLDMFERNPISLRVTKCCDTWRGRYMNNDYSHQIHGFNRRAHGLDAMLVMRNVLCRIGTFIGAPKRWSYDWKWQDMPEMFVSDWQEVLVGLVAHELAHIKYSGLKKGESGCDWVAVDAVEAFRKVRGDYDAFVANHILKQQGHQVAMAAKQSPEAVAQRELDKTHDMVAKWQRRQKLAASKLKKYERKLKRLERKATQ